MAEMGGMTTLFLLLCVSATVSRGLDLQKRIIGGHNCDPKERLHHARFVDYMDDDFCGGTLITNQWILTAAHCLQWLMFAYVGERGIVAKPIKIIDYKLFTDESHDIMLVKLENTVTTVPVKLPDCDLPFPVHELFEIAGYGPTTANPRTDPDPPDNLQCADIDIYENKAKQYRKLPSYERYHFRTGVETCPGDSGGGILRKSDRVIYGVHIRGHRKACGKISSMTDVCPHFNWINDIINPLINP